MKYNQFGRTGLFVSEICLGAMTFGGNPTGLYLSVGSLEQEAADKIIAKSFEHGVNFIDTADVYSLGRSERVVGQALKNLGIARKDVVIATKVYSQMGPGPNDGGASRGHIMDSVQASLERLQTSHIDLYQIHGTDPVTPVDEILRALDDLTRQGLVRYIGISNWAAWRIAKALGISAAKNYARFESVQAYYTIAGRDLEREIVPLLEEEKLGLMVWSPLAGGFLSGKYTRENAEAGPEGSRRTTFDFPPVDKERAYDCVEAMQPIARAHGVSVARVALAYVLAKPFVTSVIIGAKTVEQVEDNLAATDLTLTPEEIAHLDQVSALKPEYPGWMFARQGGWRVPKPFTKD